MSRMILGEFPPEAKFGTLEYWRDRCKKVEAINKALEEHIAKSAPLTWVMDYNIDAAREWEREAIELLEDN